MDRIDEAALLDGLRNGNEEAFELMVRTYGGRMLAVARRMCRPSPALRASRVDASSPPGSTASSSMRP